MAEIRECNCEACEELRQSGAEGAAFVKALAEWEQGDEPTEQQEEIVRLQPRLVPDGDGFVIRMLPAANGEYVAYSDLAALREHRVFTDLAAAREQIARLESKKAQAFNDGMEAAALFVDSLRGEGVSDLREVRDGIRSEVKRPTPPQADMEDKG